MEHCKIKLPTSVQWSTRDIEYAMTIFDVSDVFVKIWHVIPNKAEFLQIRFPYYKKRGAKCCKKAGPDKILPNVLQNSKTRNELEILLVVALKETQFVILPFSIVGDTLYTVKPICV